MPSRDYIDFKVYVAAASEGEEVRQVAVLTTAAGGEAIVPVTVSFDHTPRAHSLA